MYVRTYVSSFKLRMNIINYIKIEKHNESAELDNCVRLMTIPREDVSHSSRHHIACFKATEGFHFSYHAALSLQYSVASHAATRVTSCLHSSGLRFLCYNDVRFACGLEACNLLTYMQ
jgi:hypothetical protein